MTPKKKRLRRIRKLAKRAGLKMLKRFEGLSLTAYRDSAGVWTIGYGHTGDVDGVPIHAGMRITEAKADKLLVEDLRWALDAVDEQTTVKLNPFQRWALAVFTYNVGAGALGSSTLLRKLNRGRYRAVPRQLMRWIYAGGIALEGLRRRRRAEGKLFQRTPKKGRTV